MANKEVLDKKTLEKYRKQIHEDFENNYKDELVKELSNKVSSEVKSKFNKEYKQEIIDEVTVEVKDTVKNEIIREEKQIGRWKNFKIFRLSVYILALIAIIVYVTYRLYQTDNLDLIQYDYEPKKKEVVPTTEPIKEEPKVDYLAMYGSLINTFKVYDYTLYKGSIKAINMNMASKLQMAYSTLKEEDMEIEGTIITISSDKLRDAYIKLFGTDDYTPESFDIYNIKFVYSPNKNEYIAILSLSNTEDVKYEAYEANEDSEYITVKAYVAKVIDGKVYNVVTNKLLGDYTHGLNDYKTKLSVVTFKFTKDKHFYSIASE